MSRHRKLTPEAEAALIAWYAQYQAMLTQLRRFGSISQKAREHGIGTRTLFLICNRKQEAFRRAKRISTRYAASTVDAE